MTVSAQMCNYLPLGEVCGANPSKRSAEQDVQNKQDFLKSSPEYPVPPV